MNKYSKFRINEAGVDRPVLPHRLDVRLEVEPHVGAAPLPLQSQYRLTGTFGVLFWANPAEKAGASRQAYRTMMSGLHRDELALLWELRQAVSDGSRDVALQLLDILEAGLEGKFDE